MAKQEVDRGDRAETTYDPRTDTTTTAPTHPITGFDQSVPQGIQGSGIAGTVQSAPRVVSIGRIVHVTDAQTGLIHPAIVTHVSDAEENLIATVFRPNETVAGVGFPAAIGNLASPGRWHWPT